MTDRQRMKKAIPLLSAWFAENKRNLPFRTDPTPYRVWVSEIMLQQTRIEAVLPKFAAFMEAAPDVPSLAVLEDDRLMKLWEGLGYYARARNLKKAAILVCKEYGGVLPQTPEELKKLPGIGDYTAGAIASIAFGQPSPAVDGNVLRVVSRLFASEKDVTLPPVKKEITELLRSVYPRGKEASVLTESLMELGESVCIPNGEPLCASCPVRALCLARQRGNPTDFPVRGEKKPRRLEEKTVFLLFCRGRIALHKRPDSGLLAGMWELPNFPESLTEREAFAFLSDAGFDPHSVDPCGEVTHLFTHIEWRMRGYAAECGNIPPGYRAVTPRELSEETAIPSAFRPFVGWIKKNVQK